MSGQFSHSCLSGVEVGGGLGARGWIGGGGGGEVEMNVLTPLPQKVEWRWGVGVRGWIATGAQGWLGGVAGVGSTWRVLELLPGAGGRGTGPVRWGAGVLGKELANGFAYIGNEPLRFLCRTKRETNHSQRIQRLSFL